MQKFGLNTIDSWAARSGALFRVAVVTLTFLIGYFDFATGPHVSMSAFYLLPLSVAAWWTEFVFALAIAGLSVGVWMTGNMINGDVDFLDTGLAIWNGGVQLVSFVALVFVLDRLKLLQRSLERRVHDRTAALEKLQIDIMHSSEREQQRIGQELHDGLCQHLAATAYICQVLQESLAEKRLPEAQSAEELVRLLREGVFLSRQTAKGLDPVEMNSQGLMQALEDFAAATGKLFKVSCKFECETPVLVHESTQAQHLFRIAQEAVRNAISHGEASEIVVALENDENGLEMRIEDNGIGIRRSTSSEKGMGLVIMRRRAAIIGAQFEVTQRPEGGTRVRCHVPAVVQARTKRREQESV